MATVVKIYISPQTGGQQQALDEVEAVEFSGLSGDRYFKLHTSAPGNQGAVTLLDISQVELCNAELHTNFAPADFRRNLVTEGIDLNSLVGHEFMVGETRLRGFELCQPCGYISELLGADLLRSLDQRGGLRAWIISSGRIKTGDPVVSL